MHPGKVFVLIKLFNMFSISFITTVYVPLMLQIGLSLADVALLNLFFWVSVSLAELPTGMMADGRSRAWSVRTGLLMFFIGLVVYANFIDFHTALAAEVLIGIGFAFISGADQAWLTDALIKRGEASQLKRWLGTSTIASSLAMLFGGASGALLGSIHLRLSLWTAAAIAGFALWLGHRFMTDEGEPEERLTELAALKGSWQLLGGSYSLKWAVVASMLFGLVLPFNYYWTPMFGSYVGQAGLAWIWVPLYGSMTLAGWLVRSRNILENRDDTGLILGVAVAGIGLALAGCLPGLGLILLSASLHELGRGIFQPFLGVYTQRRVTSGCRATFGSLQSLLGRAGYAVILLGLWLITLGQPTERPVMSGVWLLAGSLLVISALCLWLFKPRGTEAAPVIDC